MSTPEQKQPPEIQSPHASFNIGLAMGLTAGLIMTVLLVALRFTMDTVVFPGVIADRLTQVAPGAIPDFMPEHLQVKAEPLMFLSLIAGQVAVGATLGDMYASYCPRLPFDERTWRRGLFIGADRDTQGYLSQRGLRAS